MPRKSKRIKKELKLTKSDALFGSKRGCYKKSPTVQSISTMFGRKNRELYAWHINKIHQKIKEGKISDEDYEKHVELIPKFHPHACRKYFCSTIQRYTANERRYRLMEGHAPKNKLDKSYIEISKDEIAETYEEAVKDLSIYYVNKKEIEELREKFNEDLKEQDKKHQEKIESLKNYYEDRISSLSDKVGKTSEMVTQIKNKTDKKYIKESIEDYFSKNYKREIMEKSDFEEGWIKCLVIQDLAYKYALNDDFDESPQTLNKYISKAIVQCNLHPEIIQEAVRNRISHNGMNNIQIDKLFNQIYKKLKTYDDIRLIIGSDKEKLREIFLKCIHSSKFDTTKMSNEDEKRLMEAIMMEFIS